MKQAAIAYMRDPKTKGVDAPYGEKFAEFLNAVATAKVKEIKRVVVPQPWVLGDTKEELILSLTQLAGSGVSLEIIEP